jgi:hypothetical protein
MPKKRGHCPRFFVHAKFPAMKFRFDNLFTLAWLLALPGTATSVELTLATDIRYFDYEEFGTNNQSLDHETGFIPGIKIAGDMIAFTLHHTVELGI